MPNTDGDQQRHPFSRLLHLLWALPLSAIISFGLLIIAAIEECGISGCGGGGFGVATGGRGAVPLFTWGIGLVWFVILAAVPWLRPWWLRCGIAVVVGLAFGSFFTSAITPAAGG